MLARNLMYTTATCNMNTMALMTAGSTCGKTVCGDTGKDEAHMSWRQT